MEFSRPEYWGVGSLTLLQGIFPTQGSNPGKILCQLNHKGKPKNTGMGSLSLFPSSIPGFGRSAGERNRLPTPVFLGFACGLAGKESTPGLVPGLGLSSGEGKVYPLQYSGLENSIDCKVHGVTKNRHTWLSNLQLHFTSPILVLFSLNPFGSLLVFYVKTVSQPATLHRRDSAYICNLVPVLQENWTVSNKHHTSMSFLT